MLGRRPGPTRRLSLDPIAFTATAIDAQDGDVAASLVWESDLDGVIGSGPDFSSSDLSVGIHAVTATASDGQGNQGSAGLTISVNTAPEVTITSPAASSLWLDTDDISFAATADDVEDGNLAAALAWSSDLDGAIGSGASFQLGSLSVGTHQITASVTDSVGSLGSATLSITVHSAIFPNVSIASPADGSVVVLGDPVSFAGSASDVQDGDLSASLAWSSDLDGPIGSGASFSTSSLSSGLHSISASALDGQGNPGSDGVGLRVHAAPLVSIGLAWLPDFVLLQLGGSARASTAPGAPAINTLVLYSLLFISLNLALASFILRVQWGRTR